MPCFLFRFDSDYHRFFVSFPFFVDVHTFDFVESIVKIFLNIDPYKDVLFYGNEDIITLDEVNTNMRSKEFSMMKELKVNVSCERLSILRGDSKSRWKSNPWVLISQS